MLSVTDIAADVASGRTPAIEHAFVALVAWPEVEDVGPPSPDVLAYILEYAASALAADENAMPAALVDAIDREAAGTDPLEGDDYAAGSAYVLGHMDIWRQRYGSVPGA